MTKISENIRNARCSFHNTQLIRMMKITVFIHHSLKDTSQTRCDTQYKMKDNSEKKMITIMMTIIITKKNNSNEIHIQVKRFIIKIIYAIYDVKHKL